MCIVSVFSPTFFLRIFLKLKASPLYSRYLSYSSILCTNVKVRAVKEKHNSKLNQRQVPSIKTLTLVNKNSKNISKKKKKMKCLS